MARRSPNHCQRAKMGSARPLTRHAASNDERENCDRQQSALSAAYDLLRTTIGFRDISK